MVAPPEIVLGTVQWGKPYGIANASGRPEAQGVREMLALARAHGIRWLDTARDYGDAEARIGELADDAWRIVTKLTLTLEGNALEAAKASVGRSLELLRRASVDAFIVQCPEQRRMPDVWSYLRDLRQAGTVARLGISASTPGEAMAALDDGDVEHIQVATSILDQRLVRQGFFEAAQERGKTVHVRSVFLQGVAFLDGAKLPPGLRPLQADLARIDRFSAEAGVPRAAVFLDYVRNLPAAGLILGCEAAWQLQRNLDMLARSPERSAVAGLAASISVHDATVLDPDQWTL